MQSIILKPINHRAAEQIGIFYKSDAALNLIIKQIKLIKWSQTHKCWYLLLSKESHIAIMEAVGKVAKIDNSLLKDFLQKRKRVAATIITTKKGQHPNQ